MRSYQRIPKRLGGLFQDSGQGLRFKLDGGQLMVFDHNRVLHGRTAFDPSEATASSRSLSDLGSVGCKLTAAVHFSPASCPIASAMALQTRQKLSSLGPNFASTPQARQTPRRPPAAGLANSAVRSARQTNSAALLP